MTPETVLARYRKLIAKKYDGSLFRTPGWPHTATEIATLVIRMAEENRGWSYRRIQGALATLGHVLAHKTIANILKQHGIEPAPERSRKATWKEFLSRHFDRSSRGAKALATNNCGAGMWVSSVGLRYRERGVALLQDPGGDSKDTSLPRPAIESPADCLRITGGRERRGNFLNGRPSEFEREGEECENRSPTGIHRCKIPFTDMMGSAQRSPEGYIRPTNQKLMSVEAGSSGGMVVWFRFQASLVFPIHRRRYRISPAWGQAASPCRGPTKLSGTAPPICCARRRSPMEGERTLNNGSV